MLSFSPLFLNLETQGHTWNEQGFLSLLLLLSRFSHVRLCATPRPCY